MKLWQVYPPISNKHWHVQVSMLTFKNQKYFIPLPMSSQYNAMVVIFCGKWDSNLKHHTNSASNSIFHFIDKLTELLAKVLICWTASRFCLNLPSRITCWMQLRQILGGTWLRRIIDWTLENIVRNKEKPEMLNPEMTNIKNLKYNRETDDQRDKTWHVNWLVIKSNYHTVLAVLMECSEHEQSKCHTILLTAVGTRNQPVLWQSWKNPCNQILISFL